ncbi:phosphodiesterase, partial [Streptomyces sp. NRRL WC-3753]
MDLAAAQLAAGDRALVYTYYSEVDGKGHRFGVDSDAWRGQLMYVDGLARRLAEQLPPRSALYITADHGMVDIPFDDRHRFDVDEDWELNAGIRLLGGEGRARHLYAV